MALASNLTSFTSLARRSSRTNPFYFAVPYLNAAASASIDLNKPRATWRQSRWSSVAVDTGRRPWRRVSIRCLSDSVPSFVSQLEESVKKTVADNAVVVYSKTWCSYSSEVKSLFNEIGVQPLVIELDELGAQGTQIQKVLEIITGQHTVPNVFIGGKHIGGCTDTVNLHWKGELQSLLAEATNKKTDAQS
ncbi:hypothetical protein QQ045_004724 [Rhodiola kirilowii]